MTVWAWLGALAWMAPVGAPVLARPAFRRFPLVSRAVLAAGVGAALVSFVMTLFALAGAPWSAAAVLGTSALIALALSTLVRGPEPDAAAPGPAGTAGVVAAAVATACVLGALGVTLSGAATSMDLFLFWGPKAQQFALARGVDVAFLRDPSHEYMHAYYPPLVTNLGAFAAIVGGGFSWSAAALTFPLLLGALAAALPGLLRGATSRAAAASASALAVAVVAVLGIRANMAGNGDVPLLFFETLAMALLLRRDAGDAPVQLLAGLLLAGAAAAKVEGLVFALAAAALFEWPRRRPARRALASSARLLLPAAATLGSWLAFGAVRRLFGAYSEYGPFWTVYGGRAASVTRGIAAALAHTGRGLPYAIPLLSLLAAGRLGPRARLPLGTAAALAAFLVFAYLHLAEDPGVWISWSAARVLAPVPVLFALSAATADDRGMAGRP